MMFMYPSMAPLLARQNTPPQAESRRTQGRYVSPDKGILEYACHDCDVSRWANDADEHVQCWSCDKVLTSCRIPAGHPEGTRNTGAWVPGLNIMYWHRVKGDLRGT